MQAYRGYTENGRAVPSGNPALPDGCRVIITVLDEPVEPAPHVADRLDALKRFRQGMRDTGALPPEFDSIVGKRLDISREIDL